MMRIRLFLPSTFAGLLLLIAVQMQAQDIHFTLHGMTPLAFNPANTGNFYGSYRVSALYRDQYRSVAGSGGFKTPTLSVDVPAIKGFREKDWVGVGLFIYSDKSGEAGLTQGSTKISAAYHLAMNKKGSTMLSVAYQTGSVGRKIADRNKLRFEDGLLSGTPDDPMSSADFGNIEDDSKGKAYTDHVGGLLLTSKYNKTDEFSIGFAMGKIGNANWSLLTGGGGDYKLHPRFHFQAGMSSVMSDKVRFSPSITYQRVLEGSQATLVAQGMIDYLANQAKNTILVGGLGYRSGQGIGDAIQVMVGSYIKDIKIMLGYDINISSLSAASGSVGGFELAAQYIGKIYKRPKPDPVIFCPRF
ncbi:MAG TPA: PorP/SprF family type IX secretion system membrane protein [Saprospiraceae bacterium]|nr:PorP/SprF family type IX secretion system membrane protein [Saprospiraceae bacterium]